MAISGGETAHGRRRPYKHTSAQRQWQVKPHTVGIQQGCREGCPDGWRGALHRVHEALPREQLSEARRRGNRTRSAHKGRCRRRHVRRSRTRRQTCVYRRVRRASMAGGRSHSLSFLRENRKRSAKPSHTSASAPSASGGETAHDRQMPSHKKEGKRPVASANAPSISGGETAHGRQMPNRKKGQAPSESGGVKTRHGRHTTGGIGGDAPAWNGKPGVSVGGVDPCTGAAIRAV